ncbi:MAG: FG-GAP repeat domain-containing protein [Solirubrobacteraceae bacterium]
MLGLASRSSSTTVAGGSPALEASGGPARPRRSALTARAAAILALALAAPATAAPELGPAETLFSSDGPWSIQVADMNGDGRADVITGSLTSAGGLRVALQQPDGTFTSTKIADEGGSSRGVYVTDFNVDGRPDVVVRRETLRPLLQNGDGTFTPGTSFPAPNTPAWSMGVGDVDDDGRPDIVVGGAAPRGLAVALQQPDGTFLALPPAPVPGAQIDDIEVGDVDGDGFNEIVAADATGGRIVIASMQGLSLVVDAMVPVPGFPTGIAVDDIDGDGKDEVTVARWSAALVSIVEHDGGAYVLRPDSYPTDPAGPGAVEIADFDGDGRPDILVGSGGGRSWTRVHVLHQQVDGGFVRTDHPYGSAIGAWGFAVGDIDGDGDPDVVLADPSDENRVVLLRNKRDTTDPTVTLTTPVDGATYDRGATVNADFACADGTRGSGIDTCVGTVADGDPIDTATSGPKSFQVTATDHAGNTASKSVTYTVVASAPEPAPVSASGPMPVPVDQGATIPPSAPVSSCRTPFVTIIDLRPTGNGRRPRTKVLAVAAKSLAGSSVAVRRDGRRIGTGRVGTDGRISISVPAPTRKRARVRSRYRLVVGDARSRALKATRRATITSRESLRNGGLRITGRIVGLRHVRTLTVTGEPVCGDDEPSHTRIRTDRNGRFRVTLDPPRRQSEAVSYRIRYANRTATLPVLLTRSDRARQVDGRGASRRGQSPGPRPTRGGS